jgi:hypothetical protein
MPQQYNPNLMYETFNALQGVRQAGARRQAGNALASGNQSGAASILGAAGDLQSQRVLQSDMTRDADRILEQEQEEIEARKTFVLQGLDALERVALSGGPPEQVQEVWTTQLRPVMASMGMDEEALRQLDEADKSPQSLQAFRSAFGGTNPAPWANDQRMGNVIARPDRITGQYAPVYTAPETPNVPTGWMMNEDGSISPRPGYVQGQRELSAAGRAPPRPRSGGGGGLAPRSSAPAAGGGGGGALPPGFTIRRR